MSIDPSLLDQLTDEWLAGRRTLGDIAGYSDSQLDAAYAGAHQLFCAGKLDEADDVFATLVTVAPDRPRFWRALAACRLRRGDTLGAIVAASMVLAREASDVFARLVRGEAWLAFRQLALAREDLHACAESPEAEPEQRQRARSLLAMFEVQR